MQINGSTSRRIICCPQGGRRVLLSIQASQQRDNFTSRTLAIKGNLRGLTIFSECTSYLKNTIVSDTENTILRV